MMKSKLKYIYGPVYSWRMGMSLGIDPITTSKKICNYDCIYCQLGRTTQFYTERENFVVVEVLGKEKGFKERMEAEEEAKFKEKKEKKDDVEDKAQKSAEDSKENVSEEKSSS